MENVMKIIKSLKRFWYYSNIRKRIKRTKRWIPRFAVRYTRCNLTGKFMFASKGVIRAGNDVIRTAQDFQCRLLL